MTLLNGHVVKRHGAFSEISRCDHNVVQIATKKHNASPNPFRNNYELNHAPKQNHQNKML